MEQSGDAGGGLRRASGLPSFHFLVLLADPAGQLPGASGIADSPCRARFLGRFLASLPSVAASDRLPVQKYLALGCDFE
jgi:hypothetical protein